MNNSRIINIPFKYIKTYKHLFINFLDKFSRASFRHFCTFLWRYNYWWKTHYYCGTLCRRRRFHGSIWFKGIYIKWGSTASSYVHLICTNSDSIVTSQNILINKYETRETVNLLQGYIWYKNFHIFYSADKIFFKKLPGDAGFNIF